MSDIHKLVSEFRLKNSQDATFELDSTYDPMSWFELSRLQRYDPPRWSGDNSMKEGEAGDYVRYDDVVLMIKRAMELRPEGDLSSLSSLLEHLAGGANRQSAKVDLGLLRE